MRRLVRCLAFSLALAGCDTRPEGEPCSTDPECDDAHACTIDSCGIEGLCRHEPVDALCGAGESCSITVGCTSGGADGGVRGDGGGSDDDGGRRPDGSTETCTDGERSCDGSTPVVCRSGVLEEEAPCPIDCAGGECVSTVACTPSAYRCNDGAVEVCNTAGSAWLYVRTCVEGCSDGLCTGACIPEETRCNGDTVERCEGGTSWTSEATCTTFCTHGSCALDGLDVAANMELDGEIVVDGDVLVRSGATLRSPSGDLTLRARSITVQAGGSIAVDATGLGSEGAGYEGYFCSGGYNGGSGGGHGTAGTIGPTGSSGVVCTSPGPAFGSSTDSTVARGGPGGPVRGSTSPRSPGGGVLRLIASDRIEIAGQITADGLPGVRAEGSSGLSTGGGGGGGILLAAEEISVSGTISAQGAPTGGGTWGGQGGQGRIKILSASAPEITGSLLGAVMTQGILPPLFITSSTHPDQALFYNDDFGIATLAWERSFAARLGHYWLANTSRYTVPTPASGTFSADDVLSVDRSRLVAGDNWVHVVSIDPMSSVGTVETGFRIRLNTTPPPVSSSSHPTQSAWSENRDAFFQWTTPNGAENYTGFYYVLDHYGTTVPTFEDTFLPVEQTTLLRAGLSDGIWVVHVVSVDTRGYLTRTAGHWQVRIGADPGAGGMVGQIVDASTSLPIAGALVRINRGLVPDQTTNGTGNYNFMGVPAGEWEVEISASGYETTTRTATIGDAESIPLNVSLTPM
jgi:hypothetical protein